MKQNRLQPPILQPLFQVYSVKTVVKTLKFHVNKMSRFLYSISEACFYMQNCNQRSRAWAEPMKPTGVSGKAPLNFSNPGITTWANLVCLVLVLFLFWTKQDFQIIGTPPYFNSDPFLSLFCKM